MLITGNHQEQSDERISNEKMKSEQMSAFGTSLCYEIFIKTKTYLLNNFKQIQEAAPPP